MCVCVSDVKIILAFGNYMNSSKRGAAYGFRLQSLDLVSTNVSVLFSVILHPSVLFLTGFSVHSPKLLDTKSTDRKQTLLHFIVSIIQEKYPEVRSFHAELHFLDKAALGELMSSDGVEVQQLQIEAARFLLLLLLQPQTFNHQSLLSFSLLSQNRELNAETAPV